MAAVTKGEPKETLPLGDSTVLELVVKECIDAGCAIKLVWSDRKGAVPLPAGYFDGRYQQPQPLGLGDAIRRASGGCDLPELVALPDVVFPNGSPLSRLESAIDAGADFAVAVEQVTPDRASLYGIVEIAGDEDWRIERLIEKPAPGETASLWAVASRYALGYSALRVLQNWPGDEPVGITEVLQRTVEGGGIGLAVPLLETEIRYDCGSPEGYAAARQALG